MFVERKLGDGRSWINIDSDLIAETSQLYQKYGIDQETIEYALDKNERAHMEYNRRTKTLVVIYNVLNLSKEENHYETIPLTFIVRQNQIVTISNSQNEYIIDAIVEELEENLHWNVFNLLLHSLFVISEHYFPVIEKLNKDEKVHGILVQLPLPRHIDAEKVLNAVSPDKDVDGFHPINVGKLVIGEAKLIPCTPLGILEMIKSTGEEISGKLALVIGRSNIVGKPISTLLLQNNATVITAHSRTKDLEALIEQADIIVSCVGVAHFLSGKEKVKPTCTIIDVGNNYKDGKLVGDVNLDEFMEKVAYISPVPGGVGPLTITMLMRNTLTATYDLLEK